MLCYPVFIIRIIMLFSLIQAIKLCLIFICPFVSMSLPKVGWIGTGVMGFHMCRHIMSKSYPLAVNNRTKSKADGLLELGAQWSEPLKLAEQSDIVFLMLGYPKDVQEMVLGSADKKGILNSMKPGSVLVDHTTSTPNLAVNIANEALKREIQSIDIPVSGGDIGAKQGKLVSMCGGNKQTIQKIRPILQTYSRSVQFNGGPGKGQHTKMANQIVLAGNMIGMAEGLLYASKMGLDIQKTIQTICLGAASSTALTVMGPRIAKGNLNPGFYVQHYVKDMQIALQEAARVNLSLPGLSLVKQLYLALKAQGGQRLGTQALIKVLQKINNHSVASKKTNQG